jgi:hypothetical protein
VKHLRLLNLGCALRPDPLGVRWASGHACEVHMGGVFTVSARVTSQAVVIIAKLTTTVITAGDLALERAFLRCPVHPWPRRGGSQQILRPHRSQCFLWRQVHASQGIHTPMSASACDTCASKACISFRWAFELTASPVTFDVVVQRLVPAQCETRISAFERERPFPTMDSVPRVSCITRAGAARTFRPRSCREPTETSRVDAC